MKIVTVLGARPQFIKAAVVSHALRKIPRVVETLVHTGQHYDDNMSDVFFRELDIPRPKHHLAVGSGRHGAQTGRMLEKVEAVLLDERPDVVLVYGDTNSTLAGALAAAKLHIPVAHVEAGLRSFNRAMPEEINRVVTDHLSRWLFAPTAAAVEHLRDEGIAGDQVELVGDVMYDAALRFHAETDTQGPLNLTGPYILATVHRAENTDRPERLSAIMQALAEAARSIGVVMPLHPRTRAILDRHAPPAGVRFIDPVGYRDMLRLERGARLIVTDSGGVQKEAFFHRVPCLTLRDETEWTELVELGWNTLVPPIDAASIAAAIRSRLAAEPPPSPPASLYGGGHASDAIARRLSGE